MTTAPDLVETFSSASAVELAIVTRSGFVESRHSGSAIVIDQHADVLRSLGDPSAPVFARSTLKPFQAIAVMNAGVGLRGAAAVLATASHSGTQRHVSVVRSILAQAGLTEVALQCPADWPTDSAARDELLRDNGTASPIYMNCSGKHAAMLLACVTNGWPIETYLDNDHPMQVLVRDVVERFTGERPVHTGIDGCGAPVHALSLSGLARGIGRIRTSSPTSPFAIYRNAGILCHAVLENGWALDGTGRANTVVIDRLGVFAKLGAEGVMVMAAPDGTTVALKMLDGSLRAASLVGLTLLADAGALDRDAVDALLPDLNLSVKGGDTVVGDIRVSPLLERD
ncbi:asparaginase [Mycetocola manganoxydans]|uniref:Asparaginase n=1 Tax=Mycetocola manganoxydans TaxID=699879 RepID=A0A3L7A171_9MICO|nr:asparaginase [Mycetocola manganoxydans]RLP73750.1 asparaginase [Mycetocola manganoxydans]GHD43253.1 asparaginase [Mycetocola manganoxydans]